MLFKVEQNCKYNTSLFNRLHTQYVQQNIQYLQQNIQMKRKMCAKYQANDHQHKYS